MYVSFVESLLTEIGPGIASRLSAALVARGLSPEAARQQVSRARGDVRRLTALKLPRNEKFVYLEDQFGSSEYWDALKRDIDATNSVYGAALSGLTARGGVVPRACFDVVSGAPIRQRGQVSASVVLERMEAVRLIGRMTVDGYGECIALDARWAYVDVSEMKARLTAETVLLLAIRDWVRKLAMVSYNKVAIRDPTQTERPKFGTCRWDLCAPSYLRPFVKRTPEGKLKHGFVVCDAFLGELALPQIKYFLRKCHLVSQFGRMPPFLPILVADRYSAEAFAVGRKAGIMMATPRTLFGDEVADALLSLLDTLKRAAQVAAGNPDKIHELFSALGRIEGAAANLRGALFEMIVGFLVREREGNSIDIGERVTDPETGHSAEIDVRRVKEDQECWVYECKGHQPTDRITRSMTEHWIENKVDLIHRVLRRERRFSRSSFGFEYWTCGEFDPDASAYLETVKRARPKLNLAWRNGAEVRNYASSTNKKSILDTLDEHYFRHPVRTFERRNTALLDVQQIHLENELDL